LSKGAKNRGTSEARKIVPVLLQVRNLILPTDNLNLRNRFLPDSTNPSLVGLLDDPYV
jgi:hypothetical protein